jgi:cardiolipin synthase
MPRIRSWSDIINGRGYRTALRGTFRYFFGKRGQRRVYGLRAYYRLRILIMLRTGEPIGKLARRGDVRLWVDGEEAFRRLERLIRTAQHNILVQMFIWKDDETGRFVANLLLEAADRGVVVDITKEAVGDFFEFHGDFLSTKESQQHPWRAFWHHPRIRINYATQNDHTKVFIVDDHTLLLTGMNIANEYRYKLHDYMVELRGVRFVKQFLTRTHEPDTGGSVHMIMNTEERKEMRPVVMRLLESAREHVVIEHCYISDPDVMDALMRLSKRGVRLTLLLPKWTDFHFHANMVAVGKLLTEADNTYVTVLIYPDGFHAKAILVDHDTAFIGSMNLFKASIDEMGEVNVLIRRRHRFLWKLREALRHDILVSKSLTSPPWFLWFSRWLAWLGL